MRNIKLVIEYDGTNYAGWQRQKNAVTIQEKLEDAIEKIIGERVETIGASRTDAGVHAREYVCNFLTDSKIQETKLAEALNSKLPQDIVVLNSIEVQEGFHARYHCKGKTYSYTILNRMQPSAIQRNYVYHFRRALNVDLMQEAAEYFLGTHDFAAFKNKGSSAKTSIRTITQLDVKSDGEIIKVYATADGFLYNMVRIIVGTLVNAGVGKLKAEVIKEIIQSKERIRAGKSVPANGLCLEKVYY